MIRNYNANMMQRRDEEENDKGMLITDNNSNGQFFRAIIG